MSSKTHPKKRNKVCAAIFCWLNGLSARFLEELGISTELLVAECPLSYMIYDPLLVLPSSAFQGVSWRRLFEGLEIDQINTLYAMLAQSTGVTHIAINAPIPSKISPHDGFDGTSDPNNVTRRPMHFKPLYGNFGAVHCHDPSKDDFNQALWVKARQNGIDQVWAPMYTMFSRGNVKEKARLLHMSSVQQAVHDGRKDGCGWAAVDMYAGIGYFAFSYVKAGASKVLCWELNSWSIEGLRRGAAMNKWESTIVDTNNGISLKTSDLGDGSHNLIIFHESNENAAARIKSMRGQLPPVRHVNCGLLPSSSASWEAAASILDPIDGGWIHVHENLAADSVNEQAQDIVSQIQKLASQLFRDGVLMESVDQTSNSEPIVLLEHVEIVKSYAPRVLHCVLDIWVGRIPP